MLSVFLLQLAGGCMLCIGLGRIDDMSWRYLRLMAIVSLATLVVVLILFIADAGLSSLRDLKHYGMLALAILLAFCWLAANGVQGSRVRFSQRALAAIAGLFAIVQSVEPALASSVVERSGRTSGPIVLSMVIDLVLGAMLIGSVTASMLLGHRYLTDTGMTIAPLRRLTRIFLAAVAMRAIWVSAMSIVQRGALGGGGMAATWNLMMLGVRCGVGIFGTAVFAYMVWDCVKRRSTQSATGILYLTMVFVFIGELTGQYLLRTLGLPV